MLEKLSQQAWDAEGKDQHKEIPEPEQQEDKGKNNGKPAIPKPGNGFEKPVLKTGMTAVDQQVKFSPGNAEYQD